MKKIFLLIALLISVSAVNAQRKKGDRNDKPATEQAPAAQQPAAAKAEEPKSDEQEAARQQVNGFFNHFYKKFLVANQFGDYDVARDALYDILVESPTDSMLFTLAVSYYDAQKFTSAALVGQELLTRNPKDPSVLELTGSAFESLGLKDKALQHFESMYLADNSFAAQYKVAFLQYDLKRYKEAQASCDVMLTKKEADEIKVTFQTADKQNKDYVIRVSILNLQGMIARDGGDKATAKKYFEQALTLAPDFLAAKENLTALAKTK